MKIIQPSVEFYGAVPTDYDGALRFIEMAGRTCYQSEGRITSDSAEKFVRKLIAAGHLAMVEHSNFVVRKPFDSYSPEQWPNLDYFRTALIGTNLYVGGNLTAWFNAAISEGPADVFEPFCEVYADLFRHGLTEYGFSDWVPVPHDEIPHELHRFSARFVTDRGVSHELVRHRPCSFAQESTRYVRYDGIEVVEPWDWDTWSGEERDAFEIACMIAEKSYRRLIDSGRKAQQARAVLPNALATRIVVTADAAEWNHIRTLRTAPAAHPDMVRVMNMVPWGGII